MPRWTRRAALGALAAAPAVLKAPLARAAAPTEKEVTDASLSLFVRRGPMSFQDAIMLLRRVDDISIVPTLILALRYSPYPDDGVLAELDRLVPGQATRRTWHRWMTWQEAHPEVAPHPSYLAIKRQLFLSIDPNFDVFLDPAALSPDRARIRFEEVAWGGVRKDGIPSLDNPKLIPAAEASYLRDDDLVFGVEINGDVRAYPLRIMGWHEMFNEVIGGVPVGLAYCTLCGSGILFETAVDGRSQPFVFGSSGFLYRSNKLMFDRETHSLWNQFTGEPVIGPLADSGLTLAQRPVAIAPWGAWRARNPETQVLSLDTGHRRDYGSGVVYAEYFASSQLMFPALADDRRLARKDYVFGVRRVGASKAWALKAFEGGRVLNDAIGGFPLVLIGDADGRTVRAYERGARMFEAGASVDVLRGPGGVWRVTEAALVGPDGTELPRIPGHIAYWFAWNSYLGAESEYFGG